MGTVSGVGRAAASGIWSPVESSIPHLAIARGFACLRFPDKGGYDASVGPSPVFSSVCAIYDLMLEFGWLVAGGPAAARSDSSPRCGGRSGRGGGGDGHHGPGGGGGVWPRKRAGGGAGASSNRSRSAGPGGGFADTKRQRSHSARPVRCVSHLVTMEHPHSFYDPDTAPSLPVPDVDLLGASSLQLGRPSLRVAHILGHASAFVALGLHPSLAADIMHSCPRRAAELLMNQECVLAHTGSRVLVLHRGQPLADPFPIPHASEESMAWELLTIACIADALHPGSFGALPGGLARPGVAGALSEASDHMVLAVATAPFPSRLNAPPLPFGASGAGRIVPPPGLSSPTPVAGVAPHVHLVAMVQQADSAILCDDERDRLALQLTASSAECAAVLTANRIMYGLIRELPNDITCSGSILARGEQRVSRAVLAWAQELVDLQRNVLPSRYSEPLLYDPPAPPGYLQATFLARDIPYPGVPLADIAGMCRAPAAVSVPASGAASPPAVGVGVVTDAGAVAPPAAVAKGAVAPTPEDEATTSVGCGPQEEG